MLKEKFDYRIVFFIFILILISPPSVEADGLEAEEVETTSKPLDAPSPPLVEDDRELFLSPEPVVEVSQPPKKNIWPAISQGMIISKLEPDGSIIASEDQKKMLGQGDLIYLSSNNEPFFPEQEWVIFKRVKDVRHPKTGNLLGGLIYVLGMSKIIDIDGNIATARIIRSKEPIARGDQIAFIERFVPWSFEKGIVPEKGKEGFIVEVRDNHKNNAQHDIVYIDYGKEEGISPGDRFIVVHEGERSADFVNTALNSNELPYREIGKMRVIATQAHTSTAKIIQSLEPISKGDTILFDPPE